MTDHQRRNTRALVAFALISAGWLMKELGAVRGIEGWRDRLLVAAGLMAMACGLVTFVVGLVRSRW